MRWLTIAAALAALSLGLVAAGCGGDDDEASDEPDTVITDTETDETTDETTETTDDSATDTDASGFDFSDEDCQQLASAGAAFGQAIGSATSGGDLSDEAEAFQEFAANAPEEIREDMQTLADAYDEIIAVLADVDLDPGATPSAEQIGELTQALASINQTEVTAASQRIAAWAQENCTTTG
jgi:hypothetical protein